MLSRMGMSVEQFALACGLTRTSVYFYLNGKCLPSSQTIHKMATVLRIPSEKLFATLPTRESGAPHGERTLPQIDKSRLADSVSSQGASKMRYTQGASPAIRSLAAAEVKRLLCSQNPPLGNNAAATSIGISYETLRAVVNDHRIPSIGVIYGLARVLKLNEGDVQNLLDLREKDLLKKDIDKLSDSSGKKGIQSVASILEVLNEEQIESIRKVALELAKANRG